MVLDSATLENASTCAGATGRRGWRNTLAGWQESREQTLLRELSPLNWAGG